MSLPNLHRKLFQENGVSPTLREDIIPWSESPFASVPIVSKHFVTASAISSGEAVSTRGCGYRPGTGSLMVFMDGLCLDEGVHYAEAESGEEITLLFDCQAGVTFEFVAHDGYEYEEEGGYECPPIGTVDYYDGITIQYGSTYWILKYSWGADCIIGEAGETNRFTCTGAYDTYDGCCPQSYTNSYGCNFELTCALDPDGGSGHVVRIERVE